MRLISWNVQRRIERLADQAAALAAREPDVVALQEISARSRPLWQAALETIGLPHVPSAANGWVKPDAFAARRERTWVFRHGGGWRLDHIFASDELEPVAAAYHHDWRDGGLSDHSALEADLRLRRPRG